MQETFGIASFRSRQQVMKFEAALRRAGVRVQIITTPRDVAVGCGLSIRFELEDFSAVEEVYNHTRPTNLIGFYRVERTGQGRPGVSALSAQGSVSRSQFTVPYQLTVWHFGAVKSRGMAAAAFHWMHLFTAARTSG